MAQSLWACSIVSATYGSRDATAWMQKKLIDYTNNGADHNSWSFTVGNDFFGLDPNPDVPKVAVVTYRYMMPDLSGHSPCLTATGREGQTMTIQCPETLTKFTWPNPGPANECVLAAYWFNKDVTSQVKDIFASSTKSPGLIDGTPITVSAGVLGADPAQGIHKQLTVIYAKFINQKWYHCTAVDLRSDEYQFVVPPALPPIGKRRLNIYAAVWGGQDYTAYLRNKYVSDILGVTHGPQTIISDNENVWQFSPNNEFFGPDPLVNRAKMCTIVYRIAVVTGVQDGKLLDPNAPACWTEQWYDQQPAMLSTSQYPILADVSGFQVATVWENQTAQIDIGASADMTPLSANLQGIQTMAANYGGTDVTQATRSLLYVGWNPSNSFVVDPKTFSIPDPAANTVKQYVAVLAFPLKAQIGFDIRTLIGIDGATITGPLQTPGLNPLWPQPFHPSTYRSIKFTNHGLATAWPQVYKNGQVQWNPRPDWGQLMLGNGGPWEMNNVFRESKTVDLITDAGCQDRDKVQVNFNVQSYDDSARSPEMYVATDPNSSLEIVYNIDGAIVEFWYIIGRTGQFIAQFSGIILDVIEAIGETAAEAV